MLEEENPEAMELYHEKKKKERKKRVEVVDMVAEGSKSN